MSEDPLTSLNKKLEEIVHAQPVKVEIGYPSRRNKKIAYVSLTRAGIRPDDKIAVLMYRGAVVIVKLG